jgi:ATP-dependent helicase HrpB
MLLRGGALGHAALACDIAALLGNRDVLRPGEPGGPPDADLRTRLDVLAGRSTSVAARVDRNTVHRVRTESRALRDRLGAQGSSRAGDAASTGLLLSFAYPDRIAKRRPGEANRYVMANGTGTHFAEPQPLAGEEWLVIAETDGRSPESRVFLAAPVDGDELLSHHKALVETSDDVRWDARTERVVAVQRTRLGAIVVREAPIRNPPGDAIAAALLDEVRRRGIGALPWSDGARRVRERIAFVRLLDPAWPDVGDAALSQDLELWLLPALGDARSMNDIARY